MEFRRDENGVPIIGREGRYAVTPVEYKHGEPKENDEDELQLCAEALCLEEMLCCDIPCAYLFYHKTRRRVKVELLAELRDRVRSYFREMHGLFRRGATPVVKREKKCGGCSMRDICLPALPSKESVTDYTDRHLNGGDGE